MAQDFTLNKNTIIFSYIAQFFQYGVGIIVLPFILNKLQAEDVAIWYIFLSISGLVSMLDFGFSQSLSKNVSYAFSGAKRLLCDGCEYTQDTDINYKLVKSLLYTCKLIYRWLAILIFILLIFAGTLYLRIVILNDYQNYDIKYIYLSWLLFALTISFNFYYNYVLIFITGRGKVSLNNLLVIISKSVYIASLILFIEYNCGLMSLIIANALSTIIIRILGAKFFLSKEDRNELKSIEIRENLFPIIWNNAKKFGINSFGFYLFSQAGVFISGLYLSLNEVAELGICLQIFSILSVIARVQLSASCPRLSSLWVSNKINEIKKIFLSAQLFAYVIYICGAIVIIYLGDFILINIIKSNVHLPSRLVLVLYSIFYFMEMTHGNCVTLISTENKVPFYRAGLVAGLISTICSILLLELGLGIISFPVGLIIGSLPYNSWKWPLVVYKRLYVE